VTQFLEPRRVTKTVGVVHWQVDPDAVGCFEFNDVHFSIQNCLYGSGDGLLPVLRMIQATEQLVCLRQLCNFWMTSFSRSCDQLACRFDVELLWRLWWFLHQQKSGLFTQTFKVDLSHCSIRFRGRLAPGPRNVSGDWPKTTACLNLIAGIVVPVVRLTCKNYMPNEDLTWILQPGWMLTIQTTLLSRAVLFLDKFPHIWQWL